MLFSHHHLLLMRVLDGQPTLSGHSAASLSNASTLSHEMPSLKSEQKEYVVLVVDDSDADRATYRRYIDKSDIAKCSVIEGDCGEIGLALCQQHSPDLILLDYMLPDLDGLEFLQSLQDAAGDMPPVIMLTGEGNEKVAVQAMKIGVRDYLVKGDLNAERFSQSVQRVLSEQALQQLVNRQQRQQQLMAATALRISNTSSLESILQTTAEGMRALLDCDRTAVYRFESDLSGTILAESVLPEWKPSIGADIKDTCFQQNGGLEKYLDGHKTVIGDIHNSKLSPCHVKMLERFQVKANLVVPIVLNRTETQEKKVWGLLLAHHCRAARDWQKDELTLLDDLAVQLAIAIQQSEYTSALKARAADLAAANQRLVETTEIIEKRNQELDQFAYIASHDLRAPLRAISNLASWLEEDISDKIPEENQEQLQLIQTRAKRLDEFITGLLDYSRAGRQSVEKERVDVHALIAEVVDSLAPPVTFNISWAGDKAVLSTHKLLLQQVLSNLISNAIKYHHRTDGNITISSEDTGEQMSFSVVDDGPGIHANYHDKIFGIFQTLNSRDTIESTGIGLSIVKKIVEQQQGTISLISAVGEGSEFRFTWAKH